jgi:hypothetical protein
MEDMDQMELPDLTPENGNSGNNQSSSTAPKRNISVDKKTKLEQLKAREAELLKRQEEIKTQAAEVLLQPNWPKQYPLIRYDPENDLPPSSHTTVKNSFYGLISVAISAVFNIISVLSVTGLENYSKASALIFAIIQGAATIYVGLNLCYDGIYNACKKKDVPFKWIITQFVFCAWCVYKLIGFPSSGSVGLAVLLDLLAKNSSGFSKFTAFVNTIISGASVYFQIRTLSEAQKYQKVSGRNDEDALNPQTQL